MGNNTSSTTTVITPQPAKPAQPAQPAEPAKPAEPEKPTAQETLSTVDADEIEEMRKKHCEQFRLKREMKRKEFLALRNSNTIEDALKCMNKLGKCVNDVDPKDAEEHVAEGGITKKILFVVVNTYNKPQYALGVGPLNDAVTVSIGHKKFGYEMIYLYNTTPTQFLKWLRFILKKTTNDLTIFYTGHGCTLADTTGDESDGQDEVILFDNGYIKDDQLCEYLVKYSNDQQRIVLLSDCCHSGSIWDLHAGLKNKQGQLPNILSISSAKDDQTAKQTKVKAMDQGIFTYYFWELLHKNPAITSKQMENEINPLIGHFKQHLTFNATKLSMKDEEIFPDREPPKRHCPCGNHHDE